MSKAHNMSHENIGGEDLIEALGKINTSLKPFVSILKVLGSIQLS